LCERLDQLDDEERVALARLGQHRLDPVVDLDDAQTDLRQSSYVLRRQGIEVNRDRLIGSVDAGELSPRVRALLARRDHHDDALECDRLREQAPRRGVEPVGVFEQERE
jgi:hypothetical protein